MAFKIQSTQITSNAYAVEQPCNDASFIFIIIALDDMVATISLVICILVKGIDSCGCFDLSLRASMKCSQVSILFLQ